MRIFIVLTMIFISLPSTIYAGGKLVASPSFSLQTKEPLFSGGLAIYETVPFLPMAYVAYVGAGERLSDNTLYKIGYATTTHDFELSLMAKLSLGGGMTLTYEPNADVWRNDVHAKVQYQLW